MNMLNANIFLSEKNMQNMQIYQERLFLHTCLKICRCIVWICHL